MIIPNKRLLMLSLALLGTLTSASYLASTALASDEHAHEAHAHEPQKAGHDVQEQADHPHGDDHAAEGEHETLISISPDLVRESGIEVGTAGPGNIERHIKVYGQLVTPPDRWVQSRARFPGVIRQINVNVGDRVTRDQVLAVIESNESLRSYELTSPIDAVVQSRSANVGEVTGDAALFTLVDDSTLWAELKIFPSQRFEVAPGQAAHINHNSHIHESEIASITPAPRGQSYVLARAVLPDTSGDMAPGDMVSAQIDAEKVSVALVVENTALQILEDKPVVFVHEDNSFTPRPLDLGRTDGRVTEVLGGLERGERYVTANSYLLKADLLKSGAEHQH